jgi:CheY-like chemotaxis protein
VSRPSPARNASTLDFAPVVLIADDDCVLRDLYCDALDSEALRLLTAADGQEALALAEAWMPDVLVTDVEMPRVDGFGLIRSMRRLYPGVPVIIVTGNDSYRGRPIEEVAAEHGAVATFVKPFDLELLYEAVRRVVPFLGEATSGSTASSPRVA